MDLTPAVVLLDTRESTVQKISMNVNKVPLANTTVSASTLQVPMPATAPKDLQDQDVRPTSTSANHILVIMMGLVWTILVPLDVSVCLVSLVLNARST